MKTAQEFLDEANAIVFEINKNENNLTKQQLIAYQKRLRLIKKYIVATKKSISAQYENQKANSEAGCLAFLLGKGYYRSENARIKREIHNQKLVATDQYEQTMRIVDGYITTIDEMKMATENKDAQA
jgi:hypothetical protein